MSPDQYCQDKAAASGSSFYYSFLFLPAEQRRAIQALYAFCREVDDVVDECSDANVAQRKLDWWRGEIDAAFAGGPGHPVSRALQPTLQQYNLPVEYFHEIIDGMSMDLERRHYASFSELALYCHRVAGVVGLLSAEIFGYRQRETLKYAETLGTAFQLTNIIRDVREDAERGRLYLPLDELHACGLEPQDVLAQPQNDSLRALLAQQAQRARDYYARALSHLPERDRYAQRSGLIMARIYRTLLDEIEADGYRVIEQRIRLTPLRKLWIAWSTARGERRRHQRYLKNPTHA
ncbi:MAG: presqualene diphosphate synthase HpnD [Thiogranum sp.]|jgi:phytoene synthase